MQTTTEIHQVRALSGSNRALELPCLVDQLNCGEVYYITWTKQAISSTAPANNASQSGLQSSSGHWTRVYLYTGSNDSSPHKPIGDLLNRSNFLMPQLQENSGQPEASDSLTAIGPSQHQAQPMAKLLIEDPRISDDALYKCDVTYVKGKCPSITLVRLQVLALPERAQILLAHQHPPTPTQPGQSVGPFSEHDQLRLLCLVLGGRPAPRSVMWRKIDSSGRTINLTPSKQSTSTSVNLNRLEVYLNHTLTSADLGAKFECHVEHEAIERQSARVLSPPIEIPASSRAEDDSMLDLHPSSSLSIQRRDPEEQHSLDSHVYVELNVGVASLDLFLSKVNKQNASEPLIEGDLIELECIAHNSRPVANITWMNGSELIEQLTPSETAQQRTGRHKRLLQRSQVQPSADGLTFSTHSFLAIKLSRHEHRAQISCLAQNAAMQQPITKSIELQVQHAPLVLMEPAAGIVVNEAAPPRIAEIPIITMEETKASEPSSSSVSIYCIFSANPSELLANSTRWFKDGQPLQLADQHRLTESLTATGYPTLNINQVRRSDAGLYECQVANSIGASERLPTSEQSRLEVNFRPSVKLHLVDSERREIEPSLDLVQAGASLDLVCEVLEAKPTRVQRFHWFARAQGGVGRRSNPLQLLAVTDSNKFALAKLAANFTPTGYACSGSNALGPSEPSNQVELQLSYLPGRSLIRPVHDPIKRETILMPERHAQASSTVIESADSSPRFAEPEVSSVCAAGQELLLECATMDLGLPRANTWRWYKNGKPIESASSSNKVTRSKLEDNTFTGSSLESTEGDNLVAHNNNQIAGTQLSSATKPSSPTPQLLTTGSNNRPRLSDRQSSHPMTGAELNRIQSAGAIRLINSGKYLFIPSIQLAHKGNYSCVAANRLGLGNQPQSSDRNERDSYYQLNVALAPSFIQPLPAQTYWPEVTPLMDEHGNEAGDHNKLSVGSPPAHLELVCHIQCEPICQIDWFKNNEPLDFKRQAESPGSSFVSYQVKKTIMDESLDANLFKSIESRLIIQFAQDPTLANSWSSRRQLSEHDTNSFNANNAVVSDQWARDRILERRRILNEANYTCQSSPNILGPPVRSTTKFIVQFPPENVLINSPSDKMSIVEGSNGPRLTCEASGEPKLQYRWFLLKSGDLNQNIGNLKRPSQVASATSNLAVQSPRTSREQTMALIHSANETTGREHDGRPIELIGSTTEHEGGVQVSTLDLSNLSLDRNHAGQYICEASNALGHARQSVQVNVLHKPACMALHLYSLDAIATPPMDNMPRDLGSLEVEPSQARPFAASNLDEYSVVRETSEDFINLRKTLVLSPLFNRLSTDYDSLGMNQDDHFKGSIFHQILSDRPNNDTSGVAFSGSINENLVHEDKSELSFRARDTQSPASTRTLSSGDSWDKFNALLLRYLNSYMKDVRAISRNHIISSGGSHSRSAGGRQKQSRRQSHTDPEADELRTHQETFASNANLLTFACLAQDGNPMSNLSFNWMFGPLNIPELSDAEHPLGVGTSGHPNRSLRPIVLYSNENSTLHVVLIRRLDTKQSLNPFQMSLLSLGVIVEQTSTSGGLVPNDRELKPSHLDRSPSHLLSKAPVIKSRLHSVPQRQAHPSSNLPGAQFAEDPEMKPLNLFPSTLHLPVELNNHNWQEQIGNLLKCSIANHIGSSDICHARINMAERSKSKGAESSEYANWRGPTLSNKSLLIISILIGCTLIVFATSALLFGPYLRGINLKRAANEGESEGTNTGQSTSSQKSSVLGLIGNGDCSLQTSSDDDSSTRLNNCDMGNRDSSLGGLTVRGQMISNHQTQMNHARQPYHDHETCKLRSQLHRETSTDYDRPRCAPSRDSRIVYANGNFNESTPDRAITTDINQYRHYGSGRVLDEAVKSETQFDQGFNPKGSFSSAGSRLLANLGLKSFSRFKVDRISDLSNFSSHLVQARTLHAKTVSNSETNTTGLSGSALEGDLSLKLTSPGSSGSPIFFAETRANDQCNSSFKRLDYLNQTTSRPASLSNYLSELNRARNDSLRVDQGNRSFISATSTRPIAPTYSNISGQTLDHSDAMDEFIRSRDPDYQLKLQAAQNPLIYRTQSIKSQINFTKNDLDRYQSNQSHPGPPVYPRTHQVSSIYKPILDEFLPPPIFARTSQRQIPRQGYHYNQPQSGRLTMQSFNQISVPNVTHQYGNQALVSDYSDPNQYPTFSSNHNQMPNDCGQSLVEHIYDLNAYATPDQTPLRVAAFRQENQEQESERPRVSQLIQTFNSKLPNNQDEN